MSIDRQLLTPKEQAVLDLIQNQNALVCIASDLLGGYNQGYKIDYSHIDEHYLESMNNPNPNSKHGRNSRSVGCFSYSELPRYDILLISLPTEAKLSDQQMQNAQDQYQPILIQRPNNQFSLYGFNYYCEQQWAERPLENLSDDQVALLKRFTFDGSIIKKESGYPSDQNSPPTDGQRLFWLVSQFHQYLPKTIHKMNMQTREVTLHNPGQDRFTINKGKNYLHGPKTSMSKPPSDLRFMELFDGDNGVGFFWKKDDCNLKKEKYVFSENAGTDECFWLIEAGDEFDNQTGKIRYFSAEEKIANLNQQLDGREIPISTIAGLEENNQKAVTSQKSIFWNEIVAGAPKRSVNAFFATQDKRICRLRALRLKEHAQKIFPLPDDLPLFINQPYYAEYDKVDAELGTSKQREAVFRFYQVDEQKTDLASERADQQIANAAFEIIKNQHAVVVNVSDEKMIDKYLTSGEKVKTALLPTEPQWMNLSYLDQPVVGLLWDINTCTLDDDARKLLPVLEAKNNDAVKHHHNIDRNALPVTLPTNQVTAIFCYYDEYDIASRLKAAKLAEYVKEKLKLTTNIPIFIIQKGSSTYQYGDIDQLVDFNQSRWSLLRNPKPQPTLTPHEQRIANRKAGFFAPKPKEEKDWVMVNKKDCEKQQEISKMCIVM